MKNNFDIFDFELTPVEMTILNNIPQKKTVGSNRNWVMSHPPKDN